jgi:uncharacterized cupredoxin-like copper-binding protein
MCVLSASLALLAGGCGRAQVVASGRTLELGLTEYRLIPQDVRVHAGQLTIFVHNYGRLTHNLVVSRNGQEQGETKPIPPGQGTELTLTLRPGKYLTASTILSDQALGQDGTLTVTR